MKQTIGFCGFCDAFRDANRNEQFTYEGKRCLFDWLESYEEDTGEEIELDVIALCCEFQESTLDEVINDYQIDVDGLDDEEKLELVTDYLNNNTVSLLIGNPSNGVFLFQCF